jgi:hypothetical protein
MADPPKGLSGVPAAVREKLNAEYDKAGFLDRYGLDAWLVTLVFVCVLAHAFRYQLKNILHSLRANWLEHRYNPLYMPVAGHVYREPGQSPAEATSSNFTAAIMRIITELIRVLMIPLTLLLSIVLALFEALMAAINALRAMFNYLRNAMANMVRDVMGRVLNVMISLQHFMASAGDIMSKSTGLFAATMFIGTGSFLASFSVLLFVIRLIVVILIILAALMVVLMVLSYMFPPMAILLAVDIAIFILILIPLIMIRTIVMDVMDAHSAEPPSMPVCFDGETRVPVADQRGEVPMRDLEPGDLLARGGRVTATMILSARGQDVCELDGTLVTGNHSVRHMTKGWIAAREHEDAVPVPQYSQEYVYCINTTSKRVYLGAHEFADWDDLDEADFTTLARSQAPLPDGFGAADVHAHLTSGHPGSSLVRLADGSNAHLRSVLPGTRLAGGGTSVGLVRLTGSAPGSPVAYHLVVDKGMFMLDGQPTPHYDHGIEQYLDSAPTSRQQLFI